MFNGHPEDCHRLIPQLECLGGAHIGGVVAKDVVESEEKTQNKKVFESLDRPALIDVSRVWKRWTHVLAGYHRKNILKLHLNWEKKLNILLFIDQDFCQEKFSLNFYIEYFQWSRHYHTWTVGCSWRVHELSSSALLSLRNMWPVTKYNSEYVTCCKI